MLVRSIVEFLSSFSLMSRYIRYIFWNIIQFSLVSLFFALRWIMPDTFIIPLLDVRFCPSGFTSSLFTCSMNLQACFITDFELIYSKIFLLTTKWSNFYRSFFSIVVFFGYSCAPFIYAVVTINASLFMRSLVGLLILFLIILSPITFPIFDSLLFQLL